MGVARQAPAPATGRLVGELKAQGQPEGEDTLEQRLAVPQQTEIGGFVSKIDGAGAVFAGRADSMAHGHPSGIRSRKRRRHHEGNPLKYQDHRVGFRVLPLKAMECGKEGRHDGGNTLKYQENREEFRTLPRNAMECGHDCQGEIFRGVSARFLDTILQALFWRPILPRNPVYQSMQGWLRVQI